MYLNKELLVLKRYKISIITIIWFVLATVAVLLEISRGRDAINNYLIFKGVFTHTLAQSPIYIEYPLEYEFTNHYGPFFSLIIAPFAMLPDVVGCFLWTIANAIVLFYAVRKLPITVTKQNLVLAIGLIEMMTAAHNVQFNSMLTGWIILSYVFVKEEKDIWAALFVVAGFYVKLYGIVGLFFWIFSKHKIKYIGYGLMWLLLLFCLPMIISSPNFIIQSYQDWFDTLVVKNSKNSVGEQNGFMQDISVMGMIRRIFFIKNFSNIYVLIPGAIAYVTVVTQFKKYVLQIFQLQCVAFALIGSVIFSSSAESPTFIIAMMGVGIWYCSSATSTFNKSILTFAIIFTSLSATDIVPFYIRENFIKPYSLKALPCFVVWCLLWYSLVFKKSNSNTVSNKLL
jgi:Glycosyltransferase family 87